MSTQARPRIQSMYASRDGAERVINGARAMGTEAVYKTELREALLVKGKGSNGYLMKSLHVSCNP